MSGEETVLIDEGVEPTTPEGITGDTGEQKNKSQLLLWGIVAGVALIILIAVLIVVLIVASRKKSQEEDKQPLNTPDSEVYEYAQSDANVIKHHIKADSSVRIRLRIITGKTSEQNIDTNLVLENDSGELYVMDLQSRNGTMLNGIRISSRHALHSGDRILAGLSEIIITVTGR